MLSSRDYYNKIAKEYSSQSANRDFYLSSINQLVINCLASRRIENLLDVGAGDGCRISKIRESLPPFNLAIVEQSEELCEMARNNLPEAAVFQGDFVDLEIPKSYFSQITCLWNVLGHVKSLDPFLEKVFACLRDKDVFIFDINNRYNVKYYGLWAVFKNICRDVLGLRNRGYFPIGKGENRSLVYIFNKREILKSLKKNGFKIEKIVYVDYATGLIVSNQFQGQIFVVAKKVA